MIVTVVEPDVEILTDLDGATEFLEACGRTCYRSQERITEGSADKFVRMICRNQHESVLEHVNVTARFTCSRACSHQLVRHRIGSYSQESQRYVNYAKKGYEVICPPSIGVPPGEYNDGLTLQGTVVQQEWLNACYYACSVYEALLEAGANPEDARYVLPNAMKTEIVATYNLRTWRHIFKERALNKKAQWEIRDLMLGVFRDLRAELPSVFEDLK